jgi:PAS domain S-box-containing protein
VHPGDIFGFADDRYRGPMEASGGEVGGEAVGLAGRLREGVVSIGADGNVEWANAAALAMLRLADHELVGTSMLDRVHPDEVARALDGILFSMANPDRTQVVPFRLRRGDGTWLDVELMSSPITVSDGEHLLLVLRDATRRWALS